MSLLPPSDLCCRCLRRGPVTSRPRRTLGPDTSVRLQDDSGGPRLERTGPPSASQPVSKQGGWLASVMAAAALLTVLSACNGQVDGAGFRYEGASYVLELGPGVRVDVKTNREPVTVLADLGFCVYRQWVPQFGRGALKTVTEIKEDGEARRVQSVWEVTGPYAERSSFELWFDLYPRWFRVEGRMHYVGSGQGLHEPRWLFYYGPEATGPFRVGEVGLELIHHTPVRWPLDHGTWFQALIPWPEGDDVEVVSAFTLLPFTSVPPLVPPGIASGVLSQGLLAAELVPTHRHNLFFPNGSAT